MTDSRNLIDEALYQLTMAHLAKLEDYVPGPVKKAGGGRAELVARYRSDPLFRLWGLDSPEYVAATLGGGTVTSIHRKLGDIYQESVKTILMLALHQEPQDMVYRATIRSGDKEEKRSADAYLQFDRLERGLRRRIIGFCAAELKQLSASPRLKLIGIGMEVRHCYQTGDSKRTQADEAMARHLLISGILPVMPLFCDQSNPGIVQRYRSVWIVKQGMQSYDMLRELSGYDFFDFLSRNSADFRKPILATLRRLSA